MDAERILRASCVVLNLVNAIVVHSNYFNEVTQSFTIQQMETRRIREPGFALYPKMK